MYVLLTLQQADVSAVKLRVHLYNFVTDIPVWLGPLAGVVAEGKYLRPLHPSLLPAALLGLLVGVVYFSTFIAFPPSCGLHTNTAASGKTQCVVPLSTYRACVSFYFFAHIVHSPIKKAARRPVRGGTQAAGLRGGASSPTPRQGSPVPGGVGVGCEVMLWHRPLTQKKTRVCGPDKQKLVFHYIKYLATNSIECIKHFSTKPIQRSEDDRNAPNAANIAATELSQDERAMDLSSLMELGV